MTQVRAQLRGGHMWVLFAPVAWGALLFGAVYPWTYLPLLVCVCAAGAYGWLQAGDADRDPGRAMLPGLLLVTAVVAIQNVPLPLGVLARLSPHLDGALQRYEVAYANERAMGQLSLHTLSLDPAATLRGLWFVVALGVFLLGTIAVLPRIRLGALVRHVAVLGAALAAFGITQRTTFNGRIYWVWDTIQVASNAFGPFVNRNHFAGWMVMALSLTAGYLYGAASVRRLPPPSTSWRARAAWLSSPHVNRLALLGLAALLMAVSIVWSLSRSGLIAMLVAGLVITVFVNGTAGRSAGGATVAVMVAAAGAGIAWKGAGDLVGWYGRTDTLRWRLQLWADSMPVVRDFWLTGTGLNTYGASTVVYPLNYRLHFGPLRVVQAHNDYLQILSEGGGLLVVAVLVAVLLMVRAIVRGFAAPQSTEIYWIRVGAVAGLAGLAVQELVDFSLQIPANAVLFTLLVAIAVHRPRLTHVAASGTRRTVPIEWPNAG